MKTIWQTIVVKGDEASSKAHENLLNEGWNLGTQQATDGFILLTLFKTEDTGIISPISNNGASIGLKPKLK